MPALITALPSVSVLEFSKDKPVSEPEDNDALPSVHVDARALVTVIRDNELSVPSASVALPSVTVTEANIDNPTNDAFDNEAAVPSVNVAT